MHLSRLKSQLARYSTDPEEQKRLEDEAEAYISKASNIAPNDLAVLNELGLFYMRKSAAANTENERKSNYYHARQCFQLALKMDETNTAVLHNLAALSIRDKDYFNDAYTYASRADALCPGDCDILAQLIMAAASIDKCKEARFKLDQEYKPKCIDDSTTLKRGSSKRQGHETEVNKVIESRCENISLYRKILKTFSNIVN